jgi:hypothetical protein
VLLVVLGQIEPFVVKLRVRKEVIGRVGDVHVCEMQGCPRGLGEASSQREGALAELRAVQGHQK